MFDRTILVGSVIAYGLCLLGVGFLVIGGLKGSLSWPQIGMTTITFGCVALVRLYLMSFEQMCRDAFDLGHEAGVRRLR